MAAIQPRPYPPPFEPVRRGPWPLRMLAAAERMVKSKLFGCWMCGNCILPETAFICPMSCPKGLRNGPCRGSTPERCFVDPACGCTWFAICQKAEEEGDLEQLLEVNAPLDYRRVGCETLFSTFQHWRQKDDGPYLRDLLTKRNRFNSNWADFRYGLRQPDWWQGDGCYHPPAYRQPVSALEATLRAGKLAISAEMAPPMDPSGERIALVASYLRGVVDTVNYTDNPLGVARMSGLACAMHCLEHDVEPVLQLQTRHRRRHDFENEATSAALVGVRNILCLTDDIGRLGPGPTPKPEFYDLDAVQALWILRRLRDEGLNADGQSVEHRPQYFLGAIASPFAALPRYEAIITEKKINAGAQFLQTVPVFDLSRFNDWLEAVDKRSLLDKVYLMPTVALLKNARHARFMANEVPGIYIPPALMERLEKAADPLEEGIQIALALINELKSTPGIHGVHILAPGQEQFVPRLIRETDLKNAKPRARTGSGFTPKNGKPKPPASLATKSDDLSGSQYPGKPYP